MKQSKRHSIKTATKTVFEIFSIFPLAAPEPTFVVILAVVVVVVVVVVMIGFGMQTGVDPFQKPLPLQ